MSEHGPDRVGELREEIARTEELRRKWSMHSDSAVRASAASLGRMIDDLRGFERALAGAPSHGTRSITGTLFGGSLDGRFELGFEGRIYTGKTTPRALERLRKLHLGDRVEATVRFERIERAVEGIPEYEYILEEIEPATDDSLHEIEA